MAELDDFLARWVTPTLSARGYRKSRHTYRKEFARGDWSVISFRAYPLGTLGSFLVDASFVPEPLFDWFRFRSPKLAGKAPTGWWMDWSTPVSSTDGNSWIYRDDVERTRLGSLIVERLPEVIEVFDEFGTDPDALLALALAPDRFESDVIPQFEHHLRHNRMYLISLLIRRGATAELERAVASCDAWPAGRAREWVAGYIARV